MKPIWGWSLRISWWKLKRIAFAFVIDLTDWALPLRISGPSPTDPENLFGWGIHIHIGPARIVIARISGKNWSKLLSKTFVWRSVDTRIKQVRAKNKRRRRGTAK